MTFLEDQKKKEAAAQVADMPKAVMGDIDESLLTSDDTVSPPAIEEKEKKEVISTKPWKQARVLDVPEKYKDPRYVYRWVNKSDVSFRKKLSEGWIVDKEIAKKLILEKTIMDSDAKDGTTQVRGLILMKLTKEAAEQRKKFYANRQGRSMSHIDAEDRSDGLVGIRKDGHVRE